MSIGDTLDQHQQAKLLIKASGCAPPNERPTLALVIRMRQILDQARHRRMTRADAWDMERMIREMDNGD